MSRTKAINDKCKDCIYDQKVPGTWREQVEGCTSGPTARVPCPLWPYRPTSVATVTENRKSRIVDGPDIDALVASLEDDEDDDFLSIPLDQNGSIAGVNTNKVIESLKA